MSFGGVHLWFEFSLVTATSSNRCTNGSGSVGHPATGINAISGNARTMASQEVRNPFIHHNASSIQQHRHERVLANGEHDVEKLFSAVGRRQC